MTLDKLVSMFRDQGCTTLVYKTLADNDNSKNQVYVTTGSVAYETMKFLPSKRIEPVESMKNPSFYAWLDYYWLNEDGIVYNAPRAKLILYPQYPEVRFSGFLQGCKNAPNSLMTVRQVGRILFLGITDDDRIIGYVTAHDSALAREMASRKDTSWKNVFFEIPLEDESAHKEALLAGLLRIYQAGWIDSKKLGKGGVLQSYRALNAGGYTLEAELGIKANGDSLPDFRGWEIKQHSIGKDFEKPKHGRISLMTLKDPDGGYFGVNGIEAFIRKYGYLNSKIKDRMDFTGEHRFENVNNRTGLKLLIDGYDQTSGKIVNPGGGVILLDGSDNNAAEWSFAELMAHWNRKHMKAVYVPGMSSGEQPPHKYRFGYELTLCEDTDFSRLLNGIAQKRVVYDPGLKLENIHDKPQYKSRNQLRLSSIKHVGLLYETIEQYDLRNMIDS